MDEFDLAAEREAQALRFSGRSVHNPHRKHRAERQPAIILVEGRAIQRLLCVQEARSLEEQKIPIFWE